MRRQLNGAIAKNQAGPGFRSLTTPAARPTLAGPGIGPGGARMKNVEMKVEGNILIIRVDLSKEFGPSSSGKTTIIASTEGNVPILDREEKVGLNVYRKK